MHLKFGFDCRLVSLEVPDFTKCPSWKILKPNLELKTNLENPPMIWFPDQFTEFQLLFYLGNAFTIFRRPRNLKNALSFSRFQNVLGWSKFFVPDQKFIYMLWQSKTFCARQKDDLHSVKLFFVPAQKFLKRH